MIVAIANVKGGCGKTTIATNFAIARLSRDTLLVDADDQGSAADFTALRTELLGRAGYTVTRLRGREVRTEVEKLDRMVGLVREAKGVNLKLRAVAALNAADAQGHDNEEALSVLRDTEGVEALSCMLIRRKAYRNAA